MECKVEINKARYEGVENKRIEDKQVGICAIKPEFIIAESLRNNYDDVSETNKDKEDEPKVKVQKLDHKKIKPRGQNKNRPIPFKQQKELNICPAIVDQAADEPEKKCHNEKCTFMHDRLEYLKIKPPYIETDCIAFKVYGKCQRGTACRVGLEHITPDGYNIIDKIKYENSQKKPSVINQISKELQGQLRKYKYDFQKAEDIVKRNAFSTKSGEKNAKHNIPKETVGPILDSEEIKLLPNEKRKIDWADKVMLSPLTTVGNLPFRRICKDFGADITCGEMALTSKILQGSQEEWALIKRHESENLFGVQICGNNPGLITRCSQLLNEQAELDFIDLNLGCPIDFIYKQGSGCGLMNRINVLESVVKSASCVLSIPFTVKIRTGVYADKPIAHTLTPKFRDWGAAMINIHGRSREQRYTKLANWDYIEKCAQAAVPIPVYGTGDILSYEDYENARIKCPTIKGVSIGRGALIKPWIFQEIKEKKLIDISSKERFDILKRYGNYGLEHWGSDTRGVETTRRFMLEWLSFLHRYVPVGILEKPPQKMNMRPPYYKGRDDLETLLSSSNCADWVKITEMILGKVPGEFNFVPKHKANSWG